MELKKGWHVKGTYNEGCAAEGACPYYFGRGVDNGCRYFMTFRFQDAEVNGVDLSGITVVYAGDIRYTSFEDFVKYGSEGGIYISDNATPEQREILNDLVKENIGGVLMKTIRTVEYVPIDVETDGSTIHIKMPAGELKQTLVIGGDGCSNIFLNNTTLPFLSNVKAAHSHFWRFHDIGRHFFYRDRCGTWADFAFAG